MPRILIAEDNVVSIVELEEALTDTGYEIAGVARSGVEAVSLAEEHKPDLILMDIKMLGEMDGITAAGVIRSKLGIPVIYLTGYDEEELVERAKATRPLTHLLKPFTPKQISAAI